LVLVAASALDAIVKVIIQSRSPSGRARRLFVTTFSPSERNASRAMEK